MSDTPRTDALTLLGRDDCTCPACIVANFARELERELAEAKDAAINAENLGSVRQMRKIEELERERSDLLLLIERLTKDRDSWMECANG